MYSVWHTLHRVWVPSPVWRHHLHPAPPPYHIERKYNKQQPAVFHPSRTTRNSRIRYCCKQTKNSRTLSYMAIENSEGCHRRPCDACGGCGGVVSKVKARQVAVLHPGAPTLHPGSSPAQAALVASCKGSKNASLSAVAVGIWGHSRNWESSLQKSEGKYGINYRIIIYGSFGPCDTAAAVV